MPHALRHRLVGSRISQATCRRCGGGDSQSPARLLRGDEVRGLASMQRSGNGNGEVFVNNMIGIRGKT